MRVLIIFASVFLGATLAQECDTIQTDECGVEILPFMVDPTIVPTSEAELQELCKTLHKGEVCIRDYLTRCPNVINKEVATNVIDSMVQTVTDICTGNLGKRILSHGSCLKENLAKNFPCNTDTIKIAEAIAVAEPVSDRLKHVCCAYLGLDKCITDTVKAACDDRAARTVRNVMQSYAIFLVDKCLPYLAAPETCNLGALKGVTPKNRNPKSILPGLIDIAGAVF